MKTLNYSRIRRSAQADLKRYERLGVKIFTEALKEQAKPVVPLMPMQEAYIKFYQAVFIDSATKEYNRIRQDNRQKALFPNDFFVSTWLEFIKNWVIQNLGQLIFDVTDTSQKKVNEIVAQGIADGLTPRQIEERLLREIPDIKRARAIARTEATRAYNEGKKQSAIQWSNQTGTPLWKLWIHGGAKEPRIQHILAQDKPIRFDQPFVFNSNGVQVLMDKPGDLNGGPAQTINCSCVVVYISESYARRNFPKSFVL
jgi:hypothetical protein